MSSQIKATQITWHEGTVTREERARLLKQKGCTIWFTGLSGSGKSTLAVALEQVFIQRGHAAYVLDGDNVRFGLNAGPKILMETRGFSETSAKRFGLGFSAEDREENIRRIGEVAKLFADAGLIVLTSFISPYRKDREAARAIHEKNNTGAIPFVEIHVNTAIDVCEQRDPKGLYKQARKALADGKGMGFTGVDDPYEAPLNPELTIDTGKKSTQEAVADVLLFLQQRGILASKKVDL
jgi:adenylylsulfate kinase